MPTINSHILIKNLESRVEFSIQLAVTVFQNLDSELLLSPSVTGGWSIAECLDHLNSYGNFYLPQIKLGLDTSNGTHPTEFKSSWLGNYFNELMKPNNKKMKAFKKHLPKKDLDTVAIVAEFIHQQELLLTYLEAAKIHDLNKIKIPISISRLIMKGIYSKPSEIFTNNLNIFSKMYSFIYTTLLYLLIETIKIKDIWQNYLHKKKNTFN